MAVNQGQINLQTSLASGREFESFGDGLRAQHVQNINNLSQEQGRLGRGAASAVQQKFRSPGGGSFAKRLEQNIRRGRARQGIVNRGDPAIRNQQLKDRLQLARSSITRRGTLQQTSENAMRLRSGLNASELRAKDQVGAARAGALGFAVGGAVRGFGGNLFNSDTTVPVATDEGTAAADVFNNSDLTNFGINNIGQGPFGGTLDA